MKEDLVGDLRKRSARTANGGKLRDENRGLSHDTFN
jgi:hypothetical protein